MFWQIIYIWKWFDVTKDNKICIIYELNCENREYSDVCLWLWIFWIRKHHSRISLNVGMTMLAHTPTWKLFELITLSTGTKIAQSLYTLNTRGRYVICIMRVLVYSAHFNLCTLFRFVEQKKRHPFSFLSTTHFLGFISLCLFRCVIIKCLIHVLFCHPEIRNSCY